MKSELGIAPQSGYAKEARILSYSYAFNLIERGCSPEEIQYELGVDRSKLIKIQAAYIAGHRAHAHEIFNIASLGIRTLVDECVTPAVIPYYAEHFGWAAHVDHLGIKGMKDKKVYNFAYSRGHDLLLSRDANQGAGNKVSIADSPHLTVRAVAKGIKIMNQFRERQDFEKPWSAPDLARIPLLVHLKTIKNSPEALVSSLVKNKEDILLGVEYGISPYVEVTPSGVSWGPTFKRIFQDMVEDQRKYKKENSIDARAKKIANRIIHTSPEKYNDETSLLFLERKARFAARKSVLNSHLK